MLILREDLEKYKAENNDRMVSFEKRLTVDYEKCMVSFKQLERYRQSLLELCAKYKADVQTAFKKDSMEIMDKLKLEHKRLTDMEMKTRKFLEMIKNFSEFKLKFN